MHPTAGILCLPSGMMFITYALRADVWAAVLVPTKAGGAKAAAEAKKRADVRAVNFILG